MSLSSKSTQQYVYEFISNFSDKLCDSLELDLFYRIFLNVHS